jgi:hypothetical protein
MEYLSFHSANRPFCNHFNSNSIVYELIQEYIYIQLPEEKKNTGRLNYVPNYWPYMLNQDDTISVITNTSG